MANNEHDQETIGIGSGASGISPARPVAPAPRPSVTGEPRRPYKRPTDTGSTSPVPLTPAQRHESKVNQTLHEWANKPTADPHAEVIARDAWARKVELHNAGWEITCDPPLKRAFHPGQYLTIVNNLAASTLTQGTVYGGDPTYIQVYNTPENIAKYVDYINENGVMVPGNSKPVVQGMTIRVRVVVRDNAQTVTVGKLVKYEVEVVEPHYLEGLRLLLQPEQLADDEGRDGYGNPVLSVK